MKLKDSRGVLFDLDGVLVRTEPLKGAAHAETVKQFGGNVSSSLYLSLMGQSHEAVRAAFSAAGGIAVAPDEYTQVFRSVYQELIDTQLEAVPGAVELVREFDDRRYLLAVVSSSPTMTTKQIVSRIGLAQQFDAYVGAEDVAKKKPAPDAYIRALELLGLPSSSAVAIEDSESGVNAAVDARIPTLALRNEFNVSHDLRRAEMTVSSLEDVEFIISSVESLLHPVAA